MGNKVYKVPVELNDRQQEQMAGLEALYRLRLNYTDDEDTQCCVSVNGKIRYVDYPTSFLMSLMRIEIALPDGFSFDSEVKSERAMNCVALFEKGRKEEVLSVFRAYPSLIFEGEEGLLADLQMVEEPKALSAILDGRYCLYQLERDRETGDVPTRNPAPTEAASNEPETLISVRDASGVVRQVALDEMEDMREAAQGIYEGQSPEPTEEPETLVPVINAFGCRRTVTPDKLKTMSDAADVYHIVDWDGVILETVETNLYTEALEWRDITAERLGVDSEKLDVMTAEEYESEWGDGEEEEPETVSNAEDELPAVRRGPLMDDKSDLYFYLLEGRNVV